MNIIIIEYFGMNKFTTYNIALDARSNGIENLVS